jgi:hypothetical protein
MEATVASLIAEASGQPASPQADSLTPVSDWFDVPRSAASSSAQTTLLASGVHSFQMGTEHASRIERALESLVLNEVTSRSSSATEHRRILHALRADSAGAPSGHKQVVAWGEPWPSTELKEMGDHKGNGTWRHVTKQEIPADRRIHRLLWVYKLKQRRLRKGQALRRRLLNARQRHRLQPNLLRRAEVRVGSQPLRHVGEIAMSARFSYFQRASSSASPHHHAHLRLGVHLCHLHSRNCHLDCIRRGSLDCPPHIQLFRLASSSQGSPT